MALLSTQFSTARTNIEPGPGDIAAAPACHLSVRELLEGAPDLKALGIDTVLIGSYKRQVSIRRVKDVDVFCKLPDLDSNLTAPRLLTLFGTVLEEKYEGRLKAQDRSWTITDFPGTDLQVDVVPARPCNGHWEIPKADGGWEETNPEELAVLTTTLNRDNDDLYVPTVKLMRQIRRTALGDDAPGGLYFEILTHHAFASGSVDASSQDAALCTALELVVSLLATAQVNGLLDPTITGKTITTKATNADLAAAHMTFSTIAANARRALSTNDRCEAARTWQNMLGNIDGTTDPVFPMPVGCDGTRDVISVPGISVGKQSHRYS
jgi:hypothetical protein